MTHLKTNHENNHNIIDKIEIELCVWCEIKSEIFFFSILSPYKFPSYSINWVNYFLILMQSSILGIMMYHPALYIAGFVLLTFY